MCFFCKFMFEQCTEIETHEGLIEHHNNNIILIHVQLSNSILECMTCGCHYQIIYCTLVQLLQFAVIW